jgi:integrase/recombinase XerD
VVSEVVHLSSGERRLTVAQFQGLAQMPAEAEWFANIANGNTRRAYERALKDFATFAGIDAPTDFRQVTRAHVIAWRHELERLGVAGATIRHRLAALSSLFEWLCNANAVTHNPVHGVRRPAVQTYEGKTPALGDDEARALLDAPPADTLKGKRDRAILATLLYHGLRREELCQLRVEDARRPRRGVVQIAVTGKGGKLRFLPLHAVAAARIDDYLEAAGHAAEGRGALFRPLHRSRVEGGAQALTPDAVYKLVRHYSEQIGNRVGAHAMRATAATHALDHGADLAHVQGWLGHASIATTRIYDRRVGRAETSPAVRVNYSTGAPAEPGT